MIFFLYVDKELLRSVASRKKPSLQLNIPVFGGKNSGHKRKQMERQKSIMVLSEEMVCLNFCMIHKCILNFLHDQQN